MSQIHDLTATEQVAAIRSGQVSSLEITRHYLDRIDRLDDRLRAFISVFADEALAAAAAPRPGALHGLPLALKDMHPTAGLRTTFGCQVFTDLVPPADGPGLAPLRAAGAVVLGKTNVPEFGPTCYTDNALLKDTVTPYGETLSASGSSGGSAAAVAAGLAPVAHGSDGLGSLRTPAANCGLVALKVTRGRLAASGAGWLSLGVEGPLARTVADAALVLDVMGGPSTSDLWRSPVSVPDAFTQALGQEVRPLRVGRLLQLRDVTPDAECVAAVDTAAKALEALGHHVEDVSDAGFGPAEPLREAVLAMLGSSMGLIAASTLSPEQQEQLMPYTRWLLSRPVSGVDLARAQATLYGAALQYRAFLDRYDLVLSPTTSAPPLPTSVLRDDDGAGSLAVMGRWSAYTPPANIAGTPAISLPVHLTSAGLPVGAMLSGPAGSDELLIGLAARLEEAIGWAAVHPPIWHD
jgi:amidase